MPARVLLFVNTDSPYSRAARNTLIRAVRELETDIDYEVIESMSMNSITKTMPQFVINDRTRLEGIVTLDELKKAIMSEVRR